MSVILFTRQNTSGLCPGMNGGESNFSDRGAFSEASEYFEALPRGSLLKNYGN